MQPAQEVLRFVHAPTSRRAAFSGGLIDCSESGVEKIYLDNTTIHMFQQGRQWFPPRTIRDVIDWINSQPYVKGTLIDLRHRVPTAKIFRPAPPVIPSTDIFKLRFQRAYIENELQEWLYEKIRAIYDAWECPDLKKDPLDGKREALWHEALTFFRPSHQRTYSVNALPELSCNFLTFDTLKNNIIHIMTMGRIKKSD